MSPASAPAPATAGSPLPRRLPFSGELTRVEAFSDAVFAFAVTLLVVSLEVPRTFDELLHAMGGFLAFAVSFATLVWLWHQQVRFFHRFRLDDALTHTLNGVFLFVVLFYVYPLKFLWTMLFEVFRGGSLQVALADGTLAPVMRAGDSTMLFLIYGGGFVAIFLTLALLYASVYWRRRMLALDELSLFDAKSAVVENISVAGVGVVSILIAWIGGPRWALWAGLSYALIGVVKWYHGRQHTKRRSSLARRIVLAQAVAHTHPLEDKTRQGIPQPPQHKITDTH